MYRKLLKRITLNRSGTPLWAIVIIVSIITFLLSVFMTNLERWCFEQFSHFPKKGPWHPKKFIRWKTFNFNILLLTYDLVHSKSINGQTFERSFFVCNFLRKIPIFWETKYFWRRYFRFEIPCGASSIDFAQKDLKMILLFILYP